WNILKLLSGILLETLRFEVSLCYPFQFLHPPVWSFESRGNGHTVKIFIQINTRSITESAVEKRVSQLVYPPATAAIKIVESIAAPGDGFFLLGIKFHRVKMFVHVSHNFRVFKSGSVHFFAPAAPV